MQSEATDFEKNWAAPWTIPHHHRRMPGLRFTLVERRWLLIATDILLLNGMLVIAAMIWYDLPFSFPVLLANLKWFITLSLLGFVIGQTLDIYNPVRAASVSAIIVNCLLSGLLTSTIYLAIPWLTPPLERRFFAFGLIGFITIGLPLWRILYARLLTQPNFERRVLLVGNGKTAQKLATEINAAAQKERANPFRGTGYHIVGHIGELPIEEEKTLDPAHSLIRFARRQGVDEIMVADDVALSPLMHEALLDCRELNMSVISLSTAYERLTNRLPVDYAAHDLHLIIGNEDDLNHRLYRAAKWVIDRLVTLVGLVAMGLFIPPIAVGNALTSPGPLFYRQQRIGRAGQPFSVLKFRTMKPDAETGRAVWASKNDERVTPLGKWLRRAHIDELPQVINVLRGEMSIVGPRPERPEFVGELSRAIPIYRARHAVLPGITGWAQIHYPYGDSVEDARIKLEYDLYYVRHASLALDVLIMLQTLPTMLLFKGQ